ncbi:MAG: TonB C-terminal domain-containing protein [Vampirovibrionales bacterium]
MGDDAKPVRPDTHRSQKLCGGQSGSLNLDSVIVNSTAYKFRRIQKNGAPTENVNEIMKPTGYQLTGEPNPKVATVKQISSRGKPADHPQPSRKVSPLPRLKKKIATWVVTQNNAMRIIVRIIVVQCDTDGYDPKTSCMMPGAFGGAKTAVEGITARLSRTMIWIRFSMTIWRTNRTTQASEDENIRFDDESAMNTTGDQTDGVGTATTVITANLTSVAVFSDEPDESDPQTSIPDYLVHCPSNVVPGDLIRCSVVSQDPDEQYTVESGNTELAQQPGPDCTKLAMMVPSAARMLLTIKDKLGHTVGEAAVPVNTAADAASTAQDAMAAANRMQLPTDALVGQPMTMTGNAISPQTMAMVEQGNTTGALNQMLNETTVSVNGQQANILAQSPRQLVVDNPTPQGQAMVEVASNGQTLAKGPVNVTRIGQAFASNNTAVQANTPQTETDDPSNSEACQTEVAAYKARLQTQGSQTWSPPKPSHKGQFDTVLNYQVNRNLTVSNVTTVKSSGETQIDAAARQHVQGMTGQVESFPACYSGNTVDITHTFRVIYQ